MIQILQHKLVTCAAVIGLVFGMVSVPQYAMAQTTDTTYQPQSIHELIAYLYGMIAQLQAQLDAMQETGGVPSGSSSSGVRGSYRVELDTFSAKSVSDDGATLRANIDLDDASYATAWFQYGESGNLTERTSAVRITNRGDNTRSYTRLVDDLDDDTRYYYRAVAEGPDGYRVYGDIVSFTTDDRGGRSRSSLNDDNPEVDTGTADRVTRSSAYIYGEVDMNDYDNGRVFFVFGTSKSDVDDATEEDSYSDIDTETDELMRFSVKSNHDDSADFYGRLYRLEDNTRYYYTICVEYEDDDGDDTLECGDIEDFRTDD